MILVRNKYNSFHTRWVFKYMDWALFFKINFKHTRYKFGTKYLKSVTNTISYVFENIKYTYYEFVCSNDQWSIWKYSPGNIRDIAIRKERASDFTTSCATRLYGQCLNLIRTICRENRRVFQSISNNSCDRIQRVRFSLIMEIKLFRFSTRSNRKYWTYGRTRFIF